MLGIGLVICAVIFVGMLATGDRTTWRISIGIAFTKPYRRIMATGRSVEDSNR